MQNNSGVSRQRSFRRTFAVSPTCWDFGPQQHVLEADDSESKKHNLNKSRPGQHRRERNRYIARAEEQISDVKCYITMQNQLTSPHQNRSSKSPRCIRRSSCDSRNVVWNMAFLLHGYLHVQHENDKSRSFLFDFVCGAVQTLGLFFLFPLPPVTAPLPPSLCASLFNFCRSHVVLVCTNCIMTILCLLIYNSVCVCAVSYTHLRAHETA